MGENWKPSEQELIETLCRVRETDWEAASDRACRPVGGIKMDGKPPGEYGSFIHEQPNYATIPREFVRSPQAWRKLPLADVMRDVFSQKGPDADAHRESLSKAIDDYRLAAKSKLVDVLCWERDFLQPGSPERLGVEERLRAIIEATELSSEHIPESPVSGGWLIEFLGDRSGSDWYVRDDEDLVKRIIDCQVLKQMLSTASGVPAAQPKEPAAGNGAVDRQEPEYLMQWQKTHGSGNRWSELAKLKAFRDEVLSLKAEHGNKASVLLKRYWEKYPSVFGEEPATESYIKSIKYHQGFKPLDLE